MGAAGNGDSGAVRESDSSRPADAGVFPGRGAGLGTLWRAARPPPLPPCGVTRVRDRATEPSGSEKRMIFMNNEQMLSRKHPVHLPNVERHNQPVILFVTVCTDNRKPVLANNQMHTLVLAAWSNAEHYRVGQYIIMPDHIHFFCSPALRYAEHVSHWVGFWKRYVSRHVEESLKPLWQRECWDTQLRHQAHYSEKWSYVRNNPVRKGIVDLTDDWPYQGCVHELRW